jgi:hypothetical protein
MLDAGVLLLAVVFFALCEALAGGFDRLRPTGGVR